MIFFYDLVTCISTPGLLLLTYINWDLGMATIRYLGCNINHQQYSQYLVVK